MFRPIFNGVMNMLGIGKNAKANRILKGKSSTVPDRTVHIGRPNFSHTKGAIYLKNAIAKRRKRNKMARKTRQMQRAAMA